MLGIRGASTPGELARFTGLTSGATTTMLDRLQSRRFITRRPNPNDRRGVVVEIDAEYAHSGGQLVSGIQEANNAIAASFSSDELVIIAEFLTRMAKALSDQTEKIEKGP